MAKGEEYDEFIKKFEPKKTTDDCFTPPIVYDAIADFVATRYNVDRGRFIRPFWPGEDYEAREYAENEIVVDNPPFSIFTRIIRFYTERSIPFFLFGPSLTLFSGNHRCCLLPCGVSITYENGAKVATSFATNLEPADIRVITLPELYETVKAADERSMAEFRPSLPRYDYPDSVISAARCNYYAAHGTEFTVRAEDAYFIPSMDEQRKKGKAIFGSGYLLSTKAAAERAAAERAAAERAAATKWQLSDREREIVKQLDEKNAGI